MAADYDNLSISEMINLLEGKLKDGQFRKRDEQFVYDYFLLSGNYEVDDVLDAIEDLPDGNLKDELQRLLDEISIL